jgi:hypothetical protein
MIDLDEVKTIKFNDWKNPPKLDDLKNDLLSAQSDHDKQVAKINTWLDNLNITGSAKVNNGKNRSNVVPKLIRKQAEWRYSALTEAFLSTEDLFNTDPVTFEDRKAAVQNGLVLNNQFNTKLNKTALVDEAVRTFVDEGTLIGRIGWEYQEEIVEEVINDYEFIPSNDPEYIQKLQELIQGKQDDPINFQQTVPEEFQQAVELSLQNNVPIYPNLIGSHIEKNVKVIKNQPTVKICEYQDIIIDPSCRGDLDKANFIIYKFETSLSELKKEGKYSNLEAIEPSDALPLHDDSYRKESYTFQFKDKPRQKLTAYEYWGYWDINGDDLVKPIVVTWINNTIIRMEENPFPFKSLPFEIAQYLPVRKNCYGEPDGSLLEDNQKIIGAITRGMIDLMGRSANAQQGISKDALDPVNKKKFKSGDDYEFNPNKHPSEAFFMHQYPEIPKSAEYMINFQNFEAESLTGVKSFNQGVSSQSLGDVAAGIRGALDAASKRELGILRRLADWFIRIGRKFVAMNAEWLSEEEVIRITNEEFVTIRRDDLAGNIDIKLTISTAEADEQKAQELSFMLQTMGNTMPQDFSQMILVEIARLRKMPDLAKKIEKYVPQPDPMQQQMQQLQMQLLQAQIAAEQAKAAENQAQAMLQQAQAQMLGYKAENTKAQTDKTNLDFVEQESGIAHQRAIETAQAQAQGNMQLEAQKHQQAIEKDLLKHSLDKDLEATKDEMNTKNKMMDHISSMEQIKAKPQPKGK